MSFAKDEAIKIINALPEDCTYEDIQYHLFVREKVERGIKAVERGEVVSQEEAEKQAKKWVKSFGRNRL